MLPVAASPSVAELPCLFEVWPQSGLTRLVGSELAKLLLGIDFLAMPFGEPMLFRIASAYERAKHHRISPPEFGPLERRYERLNQPHPAELSASLQIERRRISGAPLAAGQDEFTLYPFPYPPVTYTES
jgi:hypothetical protein